MNEEWRIIPGTKLQVSDMGRVKRNGELTDTVNGRVGVGGRGRSIAIAHLVLEVFVGPCPEGMECCHFDDNKLNNVLSNIRWDTHSGNMQDRSRNGYSPAVGEGHGNAKLTETLVTEIRQLHIAAPSVWTYTALAKRFRVTRRTIMMVVTRVTWTHI